MRKAEVCPGHNVPNLHAKDALEQKCFALDTIAIILKQNSKSMNSLGKIRKKGNLVT